jgi:hypothetical protein
MLKGARPATDPFHGLERLPGSMNIYLGMVTDTIQQVPMRKEDIAIIAIAGWLTIVSTFMILVQNVNFELFFVLAFIGFLIIVQLIAPEHIHPGYVRYSRYILAAGIVIFGLIVALKIIEIIAK